MAEELNARRARASSVYERDEGPGGLIRARRARLQAREVDHRPARRAARGGGGSCSSTASTSAATSRSTSCDARHDAVVLAPARGSSARSTCPAGSWPASTPRWTYLVQRNRAVAGPRAAAEPRSPRAGKHVVVIGGGDTAADCVASRPPRARAVRHAARHLPAARGRASTASWRRGRTSRSACWSTYALDEGGTRHSSFNATAFTGNGPRDRADGRPVGEPPDFEPTGETLELPADLVLIAIGFTGAERGAARGARRRASATAARSPPPTSRRPPTASSPAGDARRGQSLIVTAIAEGRECAQAVQRALAGRLDRRASRHRREWDRRADVSPRGASLSGAS